MKLSNLSVFDEGPPPPCPDVFNMAGYVLGAGDASKTALTVLEAPGDVKEQWRYGDLSKAILAVAGAFRTQGIRPGDRVLLHMGNSSAFPLAFFGAIAMGAIAVPTSFALTQREREVICNAVRPALIVAPEDRFSGAVSEDELRKMADGSPGEIAPTRSEDPAYIVFTSGSGGAPKGVLHAHRAAFARRMMWDDWYGLKHDDVMLHAGAFNWTYTLGTGLTDPWAIGASTLIYTGPQEDPDLWPALLSTHKPTIFASVPGLYRKILRSTKLTKVDRLRHALTAGEALPDRVRYDWMDRTGTPLLEALGMSEVSTYISGAPDKAHQPGTIGRPQRGRRIAILAENAADPVPHGSSGRLAVSRRDPGLMLGYWNDAPATDAAMTGEWFVTGDRAALSSDGTLTYHGRSDDLMTAQGYRIAPQEIETHLLKHADVNEVAVCSVARGEIRLVTAFVVPNADVSDGALLAHCVAGLADYKVPKQIIRVEALPRNANGKLIRRALPSLLE